MKDLSSAVVAVTGAATGVGRALAYEAAARGADVFAIDVHDAFETTEMIAAAGGRARGVRGDVRDLAAMHALAAEICGRDGAVDIICANAGVGAGGTVDSIASEDFRELLEVNVLGVFHTVKAFLPALRRARSAGRAASVLVTGSEHSLGVPPYVPPMTAYTTSKHALLGLAAAMRRDLAADGVAVSLLCPGYVRTERLRAYAASAPEMAKVLGAYGQDGEVVARRAFDGIASGSFLIPTNPVSKDFVQDFHHAVIDAMGQVKPS
jgi:NAD(P)-dependent dehydrogenase (short-subunit alcohol dehydrogenase family)